MSVKICSEPSSWRPTPPHRSALKVIVFNVPNKSAISSSTKHESSEAGNRALSAVRSSDRALMCDDAGEG